MLPEGQTWTPTAGIGLDRQGHVWVGCVECASGPEAPILEFDKSGNLMTRIGAGMFVRPHGIAVDPQGNVWVTDELTGEGKGQQVIKFSPSGAVLLALGKAGVAGDGPDTFNRPCDVVVAQNGDIFVADGHGGDTVGRIVKFTKDGKFIKAWGKVGSGPGEFKIPHALALDSKGRLFVAARGPTRIQIFDQDGTFLAEWKQFSQPSDVFINKDDVVFVPDIESSGAGPAPGNKRGIRIGNAKDGTVTGFVTPPEVAGADPIAPEGIVEDAGGNLIAAAPAAKSVQNYVRH